MGLSVIPAGINKKPALKKWKSYQLTAADEREIQFWFDSRDDLGLAIILGPVSGNLAVRDFDIESAYCLWQKSNPKLAKKLPIVQTKRGFQVYARILGCTSKSFDDGEVRAIGSYVMAPPSLHPSGCRYRWVRSFDALEEIPVLTLEESGFGRSWQNATKAKTVCKRKAPATDRTDVDSVRSVLSVVTAADLIAQTLPSGVGTRRKCLFNLARRIRSTSNWCQRPIPELKSLVQAWHAQALPYISTKPFDETWADFVEAYGNVDLSRCGDTAMECLIRADSKQLPPEAMRYDSPLARRLVALCGELSRTSSDGVFYLSCRKAAAVLSVSDYKQVARLLKMLCADGVLTETEHGGPHSNRASRYRYNRMRNESVDAAGRGV